MGEDSIVSDDKPGPEVPPTRLGSHVVRMNPGAVEKRLLDEKEESCHLLANSSSAIYLTQDFDGFSRQLRSFTCGLSDVIPWDGSIVMAGGAALGGLVLEAPKNPEWKESDIDFFLVGVPPERFFEKTKRIYEALELMVSCEIEVVRTKYAISLVTEYPMRNVQVVLREYHTVSEVLSSFDLDCVAVAFDGSSPILHYRAIQALATGTNFVEAGTLCSQPPANDSRIVKYWKRGFSSRIFDSSQFFSAEFLASKQAFAGGFSAGVLFAKVLDVKHRIAKSSEAEREGPDSEEHEGTTESAGRYQSPFIPFGEEWNHARVREHLRAKAKQQPRNRTIFVLGSSLALVFDTTTVSLLNNS